MTDSNNKYLIINLEKCDQCEVCSVSCNIYHRPHEEDHGILGLREKATFMLICRQCNHASCVIACPFDALERGEDGFIQRHNLRCVSCKSCAHACPFGTIYTEMLPFYQTVCGDCLLNNPAQPPCVASCGQGALEYRQVDSDEADVYLLDAHLAARARKWVKKEGLVKNEEAV